MKNVEIPRIGMRIIKSAIAVLLCFVVDYFRNGAGIVFYSQLSALWCMQATKELTIKNAKQRMIGTFIGSFYGFLYIVVKQASYFSCVVFLSIVVNHIGDSNPYLFACNRFLDTVIGIGIGVLVNIVG